MPELSQRQREAEWMDDSSADPIDVRKSLAYIRRINALLGYTRATVKHLNHLTQDWPAERTLRLIDLGTGSADIPRAILRWADRRGISVRIVAVDRHPLIVRYAARGKRDYRLQIVQADVFNLPFEDGTFDFALTAMFLHHFDDEAVVTILKTMDRISRHGIIAADILRNRRSHRWIRLFSLLANPMVRHDAITSVLQAFTPDEVAVLRDRAGIGYARFTVHFAHRFLLSGRK